MATDIVPKIGKEFMFNAIYAIKGRLGKSRLHILIFFFFSHPIAAYLCILVGYAIVRNQQSRP
jgi:hypothetical protein